MNSKGTVNAVIFVLGALALSVVVGGIVLAYNDKSLPGELIAIGSAAAGAVGGILSRTDSGSVPVHVVNDEHDAVPVEERGFTALDVLVLAGFAALVVLILWGIGVIDIIPR